MSIIIDLFRNASGDMLGGNPQGSVATSGGTSALAWSGVLADGETLTITTDGTYDFGVKAQAAPVLYDFGDVAYENGSPNIHQASYADEATLPRPDVDPLALYAKPSYQNLAITPSAARHSNVARGYRAIEHATNSFVGWPQAYGGASTPSDNEQLYVSWWYKNDVVQQQYYEFGYTGKQGVFEVGEQVSIVGYPDMEAYVLGDRESYTGEYKIALRVEVVSANTMNSLVLQGLELSGQTSGAVVTLNSDYRIGGYYVAAGGANKFIRIWEEQVGNIGFRLSWTQTVLGVTDNGGHSLNEPTDTVLAANTWAHLEIFVDLENNIVRRWVDNAELPQLDISDARRLVGMSPTIALLGFDGEQYFNGAEMSEIYMDSSPQRVVLGNAPTWGTVTHSEVQRPIAWGSAAIEVAVVEGSLITTNGAYLYIIDEHSNAINTNGVAL